MIALQALASLQHNPAFFRSQCSHGQAGLLFLLTGREKIKHKQTPGPETKQKRRLNSTDLQFTQPRHEARKQRGGGGAAGKEADSFPPQPGDPGVFAAAANISNFGSKIALWFRGIV